MTLQTDSPLVNDFIKGLDIERLPLDQKAIYLAKVVAEIPWGEARTVEDVLALRKGTCTGKHELLQACYRLLEIPYKPVVVTFKWSEQGLHMPDSLQKILQEGEWEHGHNFVQLSLHGQLIDLHITWDSPLAVYRFKTLPNEWDGSTSWVGVRYIQRWNGVDMQSMKRQLIDSLSPELKERRERFLHGFISWVDSLRK